MNRMKSRYCNDAMDTTLYLRYPPATIAAAAVQAACKTLTRVPEGEEDAIAYMRQNPLLVDRQGVAWFISLGYYVSSLIKI